MTNETRLLIARLAAECERGARFILASSGARLPAEAMERAAKEAREFLALSAPVRYTNWTREDELAAFAQGWGIFETNEDGLTIQRYDDSDIFPDDEHARFFVETCARVFDGVARRARNFIQEGGKL